MAIQIDPHDLAEVRRIVDLHLPEAKVWCFGSRDVGTATRVSDLDLTVEMPAGVPFRRLLRLQAAFSESDLPIKVDVVDWETLDPNFRARIAATRQPL